MVPFIMTLDELIRIAAPGPAGAHVPRLSAAERLLEQLPLEAPEDWRRLAVVLALRTLDSGGRVLGIAGGQGAGKTTLARLTCQALAALGVTSLALSIDDFYFSHGRRAELADTVHPLLATRGVPGTHDVARARQLIGDLLAGRPCEVPVFDKAKDDQGEVRFIESGADVVVFEGWCLGVRPQPVDALISPCNRLEAEEDPAGLWRGFVNERLSFDYPSLWSLIDDLLFLAVPDLAAVYRWRTAQEAGLVAAVEGNVGEAAQGMDQARLNRFIAHYERLTLWALEDLPRRADLTGRLDGDHTLVGLESRSRDTL